MLWKFIVTGVIVVLSLFFIVRNIVDMIAIRQGKKPNNGRKKYDDIPD